jgi:transcriptional antiterminator
MNLRIIKNLHELITNERTGSPKELALKLEISERTIYTYISYMKTEMNAPIIFDVLKGSYAYNRVCLLSFKG